MAIKTTRKALVENFPKALYFGYCEIQYLLYFQEPTFYTCGIYGWNCDGYIVGDTLITTGYRGMVGDTIPHDIVKEYEQKASRIVNNYSMDYGTRKEQVSALLCELVKGAK